MARLGRQKSLTGQQWTLDPPSVTDLGTHSAMNSISTMNQPSDPTSLRRDGATVQAPRVKYATGRTNNNQQLILQTTFRVGTWNVRGINRPGKVENIVSEAAHHQWWWAGSFSWSEVLSYLYLPSLFTLFLSLFFFPSSNWQRKVLFFYQIGKIKAPDPWNDQNIKDVIWGTYTQIPRWRWRRIPILWYGCQLDVRLFFG